MNHERCVSVAKMKKWEMKTGAKKVISLNLQQCFHKIHFKLQRLKKQSELEEHFFLIFFFKHASLPFILWQSGLTPNPELD